MKIVFLILPQIHLLDLAGPDQVFYEAREMGADITIEYCSVEMPIASASGISLGRFRHFKEVHIYRDDYVIIPGCDRLHFAGPSLPYEKGLKTWLMAGYENGAHICSICTGAFLLGRLGFLNGRKCTTHWKRTAELKKEFPRAQVIADTLFTDDQRVLTSAGLTAGIDLALYILAQHKGEHFSFRVARELVVYIRRQGTNTQESVFTTYRNHIHTGIHRVQDYVQENISKHITLNQLADIACTSPRNLTRLFKKETGVTVNYFVTLVRKERLRKLEQQEFTRKQMASLCGLKSERQVIRLLKS